MITQRHFVHTTPSKLNRLHAQESLDYSKGYNSYLANDVVPSNQLVYATDTRISTLGRQKTRQGCDFYSVPAGETLDAQQTSTTGATDQTVGVTTWRADKFTTTRAGRLTKLELNIRNNASAIGPILLEVRTDASGVPGALLAQSSIPASSPITSYGYVPARFIEAPLLANATSYWIIAHIQSDGSGSYQWSSTTSVATSLVSSNNGASWSATIYGLNFKTYLSTDSPTLGAFRAYKSDGTTVSLIAYKEAVGTTAVATINDGTGALTNIKTGLSSNATRYDFAMANDTVYYVNGYDAPRKWDFTTEAAVGGSPAVATQVFLHKNRMFYLTASDNARLFFSNITNFEAFDSTDFLYVPSPKSSDAIMRLTSLNDNMYIFTRKKKWALFGSDLQNMTLREVPGSTGTVSPDSVQKTRNHLYFCSDDGVYRFNGSTDELLSEAITSEFHATTNKDDMGSGLWNDRYYVFFTPSGEAHNSQSWVYNINYNSMESRDVATYVQKTLVWNGGSDTGQFMQCSNLVAAIYYAEPDTNTFNNLGRPLSWEIRTKYDHYGSPSANKQIKRWYPRFSASNCVVQCQYDRNFLDSPTTLLVDLNIASKFLWDVSTDPFWDATAEVWDEGGFVPKRLSVPGRSTYLQLRYKRTGVNNPVEFLGQSVYYFVRRPR